ncbi:hypothetical protein HYG82_21070 [Natrinema halophilum]|nr:hypothetical protein [Natrinema halophilum]UHQ95972.1 hypothetical protein HYG82_21070 [Natrinema halophilum]
MSTNKATIQWLGRQEEFEYADSVAGYVLVAVRLLVGYWFLHSGWGKFAFVSGESFSTAGYLENAQSPIAGALRVRRRDALAARVHQRDDPSR